MLFVIDGVVPVRVKFLALFGIAIAYNIPESPSTVLEHNVFLKNLAWLVDNEMRRDVDYSLKHILDYFDGFVCRNRQFPYLGEQFIIAIVFMGNVGVFGTIEQLVHLVLDRTVAHLYFYIGYYYKPIQYTIYNIRNIYSMITTILL